MTSRQIQCPQCSTNAKVAATLVDVRCVKCGCIWNVNNVPSPAVVPSHEDGKDSDAVERKNANLAALGVIAGLVAVLIMLGLGIGIMTMVGNGPEGQATNSETAENPDEIEFRIQEYTVIDRAEADRERIYNDIRAAARVTREKPILGIDGSAVRNMQEDMLQKTYERELKAFAVIHNLEVEDLQEIAKEGDAKGWDPTPRSNARRNGKWLYPKEMRK